MGTVSGDGWLLFNYVVRKTKSIFFFFYINKNKGIQLAWIWSNIGRVEIKVGCSIAFPSFYHLPHQSKFLMEVDYVTNDVRINHTYIYTTLTANQTWIIYNKPIDVTLSKIYIYDSHTLSKLMQRLTKTIWKYGICFLTFTDLIEKSRYMFF